MTNSVHVFFFRGLSTYGHDQAKLSLLNFGPIYQHLARAMAQREIHFHPVLGMGSGTIAEVAARARAFLEQHQAWKQDQTPVHFLAHSGG